MSPVRFDTTISLGNVVSILTVLAVATAAFVTLEVRQQNLQSELGRVSNIIEPLPRLQAVVELHQESIRNNTAALAEHRASIRELVVNGAVRDERETALLQAIRELKDEVAEIGR